MATVDVSDFTIDFKSAPPSLSEEAKELFAILSQTIPLNGAIAPGEYTIDVPGGPKKVLRIPKEITLFRRGSKHEDDRARFEIVKKVPSKMLGSGGFGEVYESMGSVRIDGGEVTVKVPKTRVVLDDDGNPKVKGRPNVIKFFQREDGSFSATPEEIKREVDLINAAGQRAYLTAGGRAIVMKSAGQMDLLTFLKKRSSFHTRMLIMESILRQVKRLHDRGYIHRDLKPANIMLDLTDPKKPVVTIIDFGLMGKMSSSGDDESPPSMIYEAGGVRPYSGTRIYVAPEIISSGEAEKSQEQIAQQNTYLSDAFSLAGVFGELFGDRYCARKRWHYKKLENGKIEKRWKFAKYQFADKFFKGVRGGTDEQRSRVETVIRSLGAVDPQSRMRVDDAITQMRLRVISKHPKLDTTFKEAKNPKKSGGEEAFDLVKGVGITSIVCTDRRKESVGIFTSSLSTVKSADDFQKQFLSTLRELFSDFSEKDLQKNFVAFKKLITAGILEAAVQENLRTLNEKHKGVYEFTSSPEINLEVATDGKLRVIIKNHVEIKDLRTQEKKRFAMYQTTASLATTRPFGFGRQYFRLDKSQYMEFESSDDVKVKAGRDYFLARKDEIRIPIQGLRYFEAISKLIKEDGSLDESIKTTFTKFDQEIKRKLKQLGEELSDKKKKKIMKNIASDLRGINRKIIEFKLDARFAGEIQKKTGAGPGQIWMIAEGNALRRPLRRRKDAIRIRPRRSRFSG